MALRDWWSHILAVPAVLVPWEMDTHPYALSPRPASASVAPAPSPASLHCCKWQWHQLEESRENKCCSFNSKFLARNHQRNSEAERQKFSRRRIFFSFFFLIKALAFCGSIQIIGPLLDFGVISPACLSPRGEEGLCSLGLVGRKMENVGLLPRFLVPACR